MSAEENKQAIERMLHPRSIAIIGASSDTRKLNGRPLHYLQRDGFAGRLLAVNPKYREIAGTPCFPDIDSLPEIPDLAIVAVPAQTAIAVVKALGRKGVPVAVVFSSGFSEIGTEGARLEEELLAAARDSGIRLCGPNNLGLINAFDCVTATFSQYAQESPLAGPVAFASQSGAFGTGIAALARGRGIGFGYFVNTGNQADITLMDVLDVLVDDSRVKVLSAYIEGLRDGSGLIKLAQHAMTAGKPLIVTKVGRHAAGARAAVSHTGSLAGEDRVFEGIFRQYGMVRARNEEHMLDLIAAFSCCPIPRGKGIAMITQSGGAGVLMADRAEELGLAVAEPAADTQRRLQQVLPDFGSTSNPIDVTGQFLAAPRSLGESVEIVLADPAIDVCVIWLQLMHGHAEDLVAVFRDLKQSVNKPFIVCWLEAPQSALQALRTTDICVIGATERAVDAAAALVQYGVARERCRNRKQPMLQSTHGTPGNAQALPSIPAAALLRRYGLQLAAAELAATTDDAVAIAERMGYPLAVKIESPDILHKTEADGVRLGLTDAAAVSTAAKQVLAAARHYAPAARIDGVLLQKMLPAATELVLGLRRDPVFGPIIMLGFGGIFIEVLQDVAFAHAPVLPADAELLLDSLQAKAVLKGIRGRPAVDRQALIQTLCALSDLACAQPELMELDLNPVFAGPDAIVAVDWLVLTDSKSSN